MHTKSLLKVFSDQTISMRWQQPMASKVYHGQITGSMSMLSNECLYIQLQVISVLKMLGKSFSIDAIVEVTILYSNSVYSCHSSMWEDIIQ